jgi:hypothetical protein
MRKIINLALNQYASTPLSLREDSTKNGPTSEIEVDPARLFHHYYLDTRGYGPFNFTIFVGAMSAGALAVDFGPGPQDIDVRRLQRSTTMGDA